MMRSLIVLLMLAASIAVADPLSFENMGNPVWHISAAAYSPAEDYLIVAGGTTVLYDVKTNKPLKLLSFKRDKGTAVAFSRDGKMAAVEYLFFSPPAKGNHALAHEIVIYSVPDGKELHRFQGLNSDYNWRRKVAFSPDGTKIATSNQNKIAIYEISTGKVVWKWNYDQNKYPTSSYASFDCTPDWKYFMFNLVRISYPDKQVLDKAKWSDEKRPFFWGNIMSADGKKALAFGGGNGTVKKLFDLETGKLIAEIKGGSADDVFANAAFTEFVFDYSSWTPPAEKEVQWEQVSGYRVRAMKKDGTLLLKNRIVTPEDRKKKTSSIFCTALGGTDINGYSVYGFTDDDLLKIVAKYDRNYTGLDLKTGAKKDLGQTERNYDVQRPKGFGYDAKAFSPDKTMGATDNGDIVFPEGSKKESRSIFPKDAKKVWGTPVFLDNKRMALLVNGKFHLHDLTTGKTTAVDAVAKRSGYLKLTLSPDKKWLVSYDGDWRTYEKELICIYSVADLKTLAQFELSPEGGYNFSPDNQFFVTYSGQSAKLYNTGDWKLVREFKVPFGRLSKAMVSAGGKQIVAQINYGPCIVFAVDGTVTGYIVKQGTLLDPTGKPLGN